MRHVIPAMLVGTAVSIGEVALIGNNPIGWIGGTVVGGLMAVATDSLLMLRRTPEVTSKPDRGDADKLSFEKGVLPCCGSTKFFEGPSGGMSLNIECATCHTKWNVAFVNGVCLMADRIA